MVRIGVDATADTVTVRGHGAARRIPIRLITGVRHGIRPELSWTDHLRRQRVTKPRAVSATTKFNPINDRGRKAVRELDDRIRRRQR